MLGHNLRFTPHVSIGSRFTINRITKLQPFFNGTRTHVENFINFLGDFPIAHGYMAFSVRIDIYINRTCHTYRIRYLYQYLISHTGCYQILGNMACGVCGTTVYLAGVFPRKCASAMSACASIRIYNNLTSRQTGISMRTSDNELAGRINMIVDFIIEQFQNIRVMDSGNYTRHQNMNYILVNLFNHRFICLQLSLFRVVFGQNEFIVLGRNHNRVNANRTPVVIIFNSYLTFGIRAQIGHHLAFPADFCQYHQ